MQTGSGGRTKAVPDTHAYDLGGRTRPRQPFWPLPRLHSMDAAFAVRSSCVSLMAAYSGLPECLESEGVGNPSTVTLTAAEFSMASTPTVEVIGTLVVATNSEGVFRRQTSAL